MVQGSWYMGNEIAYNLKRIFVGLWRIGVNFILSKLICIGMILSSWAIFSIEIPVIPVISTNLATPFTEGLNRLYLALSYSFIAGVVIYWLTVRLPYLRNRRKLSLVLKIKIENIGNHLMNMNLEFREPDFNPTITDVDAIMSVFTIKRWREKCWMSEHSNCRDVTEAFYFDYIELQQLVGSLINDYKEYLSADQIKLLELLRGRRINQFFSQNQKGNHKYEFIDPFYENFLQPSYRTLLEVYNKLVLL